MLGRLVPNLSVAVLYELSKCHMLIESKSTRLLQDSRGGHIKTCITTTVSPALSKRKKSSQLSTTPRNNPELKVRRTQNALLKEYATEVYRLKADVLAMREQNAIFFSGCCEHQAGPDADGVGGSVEACGPG